MGIIGDLWSIPNTFISSALAANASGKAFGRQLYAMQEQARLNYEYGQKSLLNSPTSQRTGLEKAGYNPMLAVQNATSGANSGWASPNTVGQDDISGITTANATSAQAFNSMENLDKQTDSNVKLNEANSRKSISEAINNEIHSKYLDKREENELGQIGAQTDKLIRETSYMDQLAENMEAQRRLQEMGIYVNAGNVRYLADKSYNASKYSSDVNERNNIRNNRNNRNKFGGPLGLYANRGILNSDMESYYDYLPNK